MMRRAIITAAVALVARCLLAVVTAFGAACLDYASLNPCFDGHCGAMGVRCSDVDALFCEDFDEPDALGFESQNSMGDAGSARSDAAWTSPPNSLRSYANTTSAGPVLSALSQSFDMVKNPPKVNLAFDLRVDQLGAREAIVAQIQLEDADPSAPLYSVQFAVSSDGSFHLQEDIQHVDGGEFSADWPCSGIVTTTGEWHRASLTMDLVAGVESLDFGPGTPLCTRALSYAGMRSQSASLRVDVGMPWVDAQTASTWIVYQDSVVVTLP